MPTRQDFIRIAREYLGTPYHHLGRKKGIGIDCVGLVVCAARELELPVANYDLNSYSRTPDGISFLAQCDLAMKKVPIDRTRPGDILVFWMESPSRPCHMAIKTDYGMLHTNASVGKVVEHLIKNSWEKRCCGAYEIEGIE